MRSTAGAQHKNGDVRTGRAGTADLPHATSSSKMEPVAGSMHADDIRLPDGPVTGTPWIVSHDDDDGMPYYYNSWTEESVWEMPPEVLKAALDDRTDADSPVRAVALGTTSSNQGRTVNINVSSSASKLVLSFADDGEEDDSASTHEQLHVHEVDDSTSAGVRSGISDRGNAMAGLGAVLDSSRRGREQRRRRQKDGLSARRQRTSTAAPQLPSTHATAKRLELLDDYKKALRTAAARSLDDGHLFREHKRAMRYTALISHTLFSIWYTCLSQLGRLCAAK
eukprot:SAG11_NODE_3249_length_2582_cov_2.254531_2_plen_281_part_00